MGNCRFAHTLLPNAFIHSPKSTNRQLPIPTFHLSPDYRATSHYTRKGFGPPAPQECVCIKSKRRSPPSSSSQALPRFIDRHVCCATPQTALVAVRVHTAVLLGVHGCSGIGCGTHRYAGTGMRHKAAWKKAGGVGNMECDVKAGKGSGGTRPGARGVIRWRF